MLFKPKNAKSAHVCSALKVRPVHASMHVRDFSSLLYFDMILRISPRLRRSRNPTNIRHTLRFPSEIGMAHVCSALKVRPVHASMHVRDFSSLVSYQSLSHFWSSMPSKNSRNSSRAFSIFVRSCLSRTCSKRCSSWSMSLLASPMLSS